MREYLAWYRSQYESLFARVVPTIANGIRLLRPEGLSYDSAKEEAGDWSEYYNRIRKRPLFQRASDFYASTATSNLPAFTGSDTQLEWLDARTNQITRALQEAAHYWSVIGYGVLAAEDDRLSAVDPRHYIRVGDRANIDELVGHVLAYPYYNPMGVSSQADERSHDANEIKIIKAGVGADGEQTTTVQYFAYASSTIQEPLTDEMVIPNITLRVVGEGEGFYEAMADVAIDVMVNRTLIARDNNWWSNREKWLTPSQTDAVMDNTRGRMPTGAPMADRVREYYKYNNPIFEAEEGTSARDMYDDSRVDTSSRQADAEALWEELLWACGVPGSVFGTGIGKGESGEARAHTEHAASAAIEQWRLDVEKALPLLCEAMGCPGPVDEIGFTWAVPPFQARVAGALEPPDVLEGVNNGIISPAEARSLWGFPERKDVSDEIVDKTLMLQEEDYGDGTSDQSEMGEGSNGEGDGGA